MALPGGDDVRFAQPCSTKSQCDLPEAVEHPRNHRCLALHGITALRETPAFDYQQIVSDEVFGMVDRSGIEPLTSSVQGRRSPS